MIEIKELTKIYKTRTGTRVVLDNISMVINPGEKIGILGRNGSGKSTLLAIIGGTKKASSGSVEKTMSASWPVGLHGGLQHTLTGIDNLKFICRIYGKNYLEQLEKIQEITQLGKYLHEPIAHYSSGMKAKLGLAISMVVDFDCLLVDETLSVGDKDFQERYRKELENRKNKAVLLVSHLEGHIKNNCEIIYVLHNGKLVKFDNNDLGIKYYQELKKENAMEL